MQCTEHARLERELGSLEKTADAVRDLECRIRKLEGKVARWGGGIAVIALIPLILKIIEIMTPVARATGN